MLKRIFTPAAALLLCLALGPSNARAAQQVGPLDLSGEINGAPYRIKVPANWNGTLLVFAHGYRDKADHAGEVDNRTADASPNPALDPALLAQGYAIAGSAYRDNGWAVDEGVQDTKALVNFFRANVAKPDRTILWGFSLGSVVTFKSMEQFGGVYDGAIAACAVGSGAPRTWDTASSLFLAYDVVFGAPSTWGTVGDADDDVDFETEVQPKLLAEVNNPLNFGRFEFVRLVGGNPGRGIQPPPPPFFYPFWLFTDMFFLTEARAELERRAGGPVVQNLTHVYDLAPQERAYLNSIGVPNATIDGWLAQMNARTNISAPNPSRHYLEKHAEYSGKIKNPVLTLHTVVDGLVVVSNESAYRDTVAGAGRSDRLFQVYTSGAQLGVVPGNIGHCDFTPQQLFTSVAAIENWVKTGVRPTQANFPAGQGFVPNFTPPPYPQQ
ncbi:MAG TPA: hypothetical protein VFX96_08020 [Pyrinomonadaceae bacterium]|nr:hypothetical protein [Pyrinomonadaceae bacterium]